MTKFEKISRAYLGNEYYDAMISNRRNKLDVLYMLIRFFFTNKIENEDTQYIRDIVKELDTTGEFKTYE